MIPVPLGPTGPDMDEVERLVADRSEFDLLAARRRVFSADDDFGAAGE